MAKENLIGKGFILFVEALIAGAFIEAIIGIVRESSISIKLLWIGIYLLFTVADIVVYLRYGEEMISSVLEWFGIELPDWD